MITANLKKEIIDSVEHEIDFENLPPIEDAIFVKGKTKIGYLFQIGGEKIFYNKGVSNLWGQTPF